MRKLVSTLLAAVVGLGLVSSSAEARSGIKIGVLTCGIESGVGLIVISKRNLACVYAPAGGGRVENYVGSITRIGVDIGITGQATVVWAVFAPGKVRRGALAGDYGGASAEATAIVGVGANVLVGGSDRT